MRRRRRREPSPKYYDTKNQLNEAFKQLRKEGIVCRMNFSCCNTCASYDLSEYLKDKPKKIGYTFWHKQEEESFKVTGSVWLGYSSSKDADKEVKIVAEKIVTKLKELNIPHFWDGSIHTKILVGETKR